MLKKVICICLLTLSLGTTVANAATFNGSKGLSKDGDYVYAYTGAYDQSLAAAKVAIYGGQTSYAEDGAIGYHYASLWAQTERVQGSSGYHAHRVVDTDGNSVYDESNFSF